MPEMRKASRLRDRAHKRSNILTAIASRCEVDSDLYGLFPEEKVANGSNWLKRNSGRILYCFFGSPSLMFNYGHVHV